MATSLTAAVARPGVGGRAREGAALHEVAAGPLFPAWRGFEHRSRAERVLEQTPAVRLSPGGFCMPGTIARKKSPPKARERPASANPSAKQQSWWVDTEQRLALELPALGTRTRSYFSALTER